MFYVTFGPDASITPGSVIYVIDRQPAKTGYFLDEPPPASGLDGVMFLTRSSLGSRFGVGGPLYDETFHLVSRWGVDATGRMFAAGSTASKIAAQINGSALRKFPKNTLGKAVDRSAQCGSPLFS